MLASGFSHPKFKLCARDLSISLCDMRGILESLWHVTRTHWPAGDIGNYTNEEILVAMDCELDPDTVVAVLVRRRVLDEHPEQGVRLYVHDWHEHADDYTRQRLRNRGQCFALGHPPYAPRGQAAGPENDPATVVSEAPQKSTEIHRNPQRTTDKHRNPRKTTEIPSRVMPVPEPGPVPEPVPESGTEPEIAAAARCARAREGPPPDLPPPPLLGQVSARLAALGVQPEQLSDVLGRPEGPALVEQQLDWLPHRGGVSNPAGLLVAAIRGAARGDPKWLAPPARLQARAAEISWSEEAATRSSRLQASQAQQRLSPIRRRLDALPEVAREQWRAMVRRASPWLAGLLEATAPDPHPDRLVIQTLSQTACQMLAKHRDELERLAGLPVSLVVLDHHTTAAEEAA